MRKQLLIALTCLFVIGAVAACGGGAVSVPSTTGPSPLDTAITKILSDTDADNTSFQFAVLGDNRDGDDVYLALLDQIKAYNPRFVINTGDLVHFGTAAEFEHYLTLIDGYGVPLLHIPGNHDVRVSLGMYSAYLGDPDWSFDLGDYRFIGMDNSNYEFEPETVAYAESLLDTDKTCFVSFHVPPLTETWDSHVMAEEGEGLGTGQDYKSEEMTAMLAQYDTALVFLGHFHLYDTEVIDGVDYIISGGGGSPLHDGYGFGTVEHGFVLVTVDNGAVSYQWVPRAE